MKLWESVMSEAREGIVTLIKWVGRIDTIGRRISIIKTHIAGSGGWTSKVESGRWNLSAKAFRLLFSRIFHVIRVWRWYVRSCRCGAGILRESVSWNILQNWKRTHCAIYCTTRDRIERYCEGHQRSSGITSDKSVLSRDKRGDILRIETWLAGLEYVWANSKGWCTIRYYAVQVPLRFEGYIEDGQWVTWDI